MVAWALGQPWSLTMVCLGQVLGKLYLILATGVGG